MLGNLGLVAISLSTLLTPSPGPNRGLDDTLVLAYEFTTPNEFTRTTLEAGQVYRVELTGAALLKVRTLRSGEQLPLVTRDEAMGGLASRTVVFELRPSVTTTYEFRVAGVRQGAAPLRVYWDERASTRGKAQD